jgi:T5SS/PEP-CTERM-associated repeat protein
MLIGSQWYVPTQNMLAYMTATSDLTQNVQIGDQTLWYITNCVGGVFTGTSSQSLTTPISGGTTNSASGTLMNGVINSAGQVQINFTETNGDVTIALGNYRSVSETNLIEMQMFSQEVTGENVTHWAYMAPFTGSDYPQNTPTNPALLSTNWEWMQGTSWNLTDPDLFGSNGSGVFSISTYNSGYFYGSGTSADSAYTLIGSATPEGNLILGLIDKTSSARTSLFGTITGNASSASMSLSNYTSYGITDGPPIATATVVSGLTDILYVSDGTTLSLASGTNSYAYTYVGNAADDSNNVLTITNDNTRLTNSQNLYIGNLGSGNTMTIADGAVVADRSGFIGYDSSSSSNSVQVTGSKSVWQNSSDLYVGYSGSNNSLMIESGAKVFASNTYISSFGGSTNSVQISDTGSALINSESIWVGASPITEVVGTGTLTITSGGTLSAANLIISSATNSVGTVEIGLKGGTDSGMTLDVPLISFGEGTGSLGLNQSDTLTISGAIQGAMSTSSYAMIQQYGSGTTILTGISHTGLGYRVDGGQLIVDGGIFDIYLVDAIAPNELGGPRTVTVGNKNSGISLVVKNGGELHSFATIIGTDLQKNSDVLTTSSNNWALVTDPGSKLIAGALQVGNVSSGNSLTISNGATVTSTLSTSIGISGSSNSITVDGAGSSLTNIGSLIVGTYSQSCDSSANSLLVTNGGSLTSGSATIGNTTNSSGNSVTVSGSGSLWTNNGDVILGNGGSSNSLIISNGGGMVSSNSFISYTNTSSDNSVLVTGSSGNSSTLSNSGTLSIGYAGSGSLTVADGALVVASGGITIASQAGAVGTLNIGSSGGTDMAGAITTPTIVFGTGTGTIKFNQVNTTSIAANISDNGNGAINQLGSGTTILSGNNSGFSGLTTINAGTLLANSSTALGTSPVMVASSGTLGGNGSIGGATTVTSGGILAPGYNGVGSLSFTNGLTLQTGSTTSFLLNSTSSFTSINLLGKSVHYGGELVFNITSYASNGVDIFAVFNITDGATTSGDFSSVLVGSTFLTDASGIWSGTDPLGISYQFNDATGQLTRGMVPEPSAVSILLVSGIIGLSFVRRTRLTLQPTAASH